MTVPAIRIRRLAFAALAGIIFAGAIAGAIPAAPAAAASQLAQIVRRPAEGALSPEAMHCWRGAVAWMRDENPTNTISYESVDTIPLEESERVRVTVWFRTVWLRARAPARRSAPGFATCGFSAAGAKTADKVSLTVRGKTTRLSARERRCFNRGRAC